MKTMKQLAFEADQMSGKGVKTRASLFEAIPLLIELQDAAKGAAKLAKAAAKSAETLAALCSDYALEHQSVFDNGLTLGAKGVKTGELTIEDVTYHFTNGYGQPKRESGDAMSQDFLSSLPKEWTRAKLELDTTGINRLCVDVKDLEKHGLYRPEKNEWSAA